MGSIDFSKQHLTPDDLGGRLPNHIIISPKKAIHFSRRAYVMRRIQCIFPFMLVVLWAPVILAQPDSTKCEIYCQTEEAVSCFMHVNGSLQGNLMEVYEYGGDETSAALKIEVRDSNGDLIQGYQARFRATYGGDLAVCGDYLFPVTAGGGGIATCGVAFGLGHDDDIAIYGDIYDTDETTLLFSIGPVTNLSLNSPDLNQDGDVNLTDTILFAQIKDAGYDYRIDFYWDGVINLSDTVLLSAAQGAECFY
jgi:hypothetical protein